MFDSLLEATHFPKTSSIQPEGESRAVVFMRHGVVGHNVRHRNAFWAFSV